MKKLYKCNNFTYLLIYFNIPEIWSNLVSNPNKKFTIDNTGNIVFNKLLGRNELKNIYHTYDMFTEGLGI